MSFIDIEVLLNCVYKHGDMPTKQDRYLSFFFWFYYSLYFHCFLYAGILKYDKFLKRNIIIRFFDRQQFSKKGKGFY